MVQRHDEAAGLVPRFDAPGGVGNARHRIDAIDDRVLRAAVKLADRGGLDGLTMRSLGQGPGVQAVSHYNDVANKDEPLDGMVDLVFGHIDLPGNEEGWRCAMRRRAMSAGEVLARHP